MVVWSACVVAPARGSAAPPQAPAGKGRRSATVTTIASEIVVDGILDEPPWQTAPKIGELIQREPRNAEPPSERTEVTLLHDKSHLYIGILCYDALLCLAVWRPIEAAACAAAVLPARWISRRIALT